MNLPENLFYELYWGSLLDWQAGRLITGERQAEDVLPIKSDWNCEILEQVPRLYRKICICVHDSRTEY